MEELSMALMDSFKKIGKDAGKFVRKNSPAILTGLGITGFATAIILTAKNTEKANDAMLEVDFEIADDAEMNHTPVPPKHEIIFRKAKAVAPYYGPVLALSIASTGCILGAYKIQTDRTAAFAAAYELSESIRREYAAKVREKLGAEPEKEIRREVNHATAEKNMPSEDNDSCIICTGNGNQLFCDCGTGQFFRSSVSAIQEARMNISQSIFLGNLVTGNSLLYELGLPSCKFGNIVGFSEEDLEPCGELKLINMTWDTCYMTPWGESYAVVEYIIHPL